MTPLAWGMFFIGMALGLLASVAMCLKVFKEEMNSIKENYQFIKKWADLTDEQYKQFEDYFNKRMDLIHDAFNSLCDTSSQMASDNRENIDKLVDYSNRMRELLMSEVEQVDKIRDYIEQTNDISDERWNVMKDYILDKEDHRNVYENLGAEDGSREGGSLWGQEDEQAPVVSGEEDAFLVRGKLETDGCYEPAEAEEV